MIDLKKPTYFFALSSIVGQANLTGGSDDGPMSEIGFVEGIDKPTEEEVQTKLTELLAEYDANQYQRDRAVSYPSWQEQMDLIYHSGVEGLKAELKKTKEKYPKG